MDFTEVSKIPGSLYSCCIPLYKADSQPHDFRRRVRRKKSFRSTTTTHYEKRRPLLFDNRSTLLLAKLFLEPLGGKPNCSEKTCCIAVHA